MLDTLRTRSGRFAVVSLLVLAAVIYLVSDGAIIGRDDPDGSTLITAIREKISGHRDFRYKDRRGSKGSAKPAKGKNSSAAAASANDIRSTSKLHGTTFDESGKPLAGVKVTIRYAGGVEAIKTVTSDDKGQFAIDSLQADTYDVLANHDKFVPLIRPSYTIKPHQQDVQLDFHMPLGADINGLIVNEEGQPLTNVRVAARKKQTDESKITGQVIMDDTTYHTQITDTGGTFTLSGIAQGDNVFEFELPGYASERQVVEVTPEKAAEQMKITLKRTGVILGTVVNENGRPVSTATVSLTRYKPLRSESVVLDKAKMTVKTDAAGQFKFEKLYNEGYYDLIVEEAQYAPGIFPLVPVNSDRVTCQIGLGGNIIGKTQLIDRPTTAISVLVSATAVINGTTMTQEAKSDGSGNFKFSKLPYGSYTLEVNDGKYISDSNPTVACERDKPAQEATLELYETARVTGRVMDSESEAPIAYAQVTLQASYGMNESRKKTFTAAADGHGMFDFSKLPSGIHVAQAECRGYLKGQTAKSQQSFVLVPGERKADLNLFLDHGGSVEGFVLNSDGRSVGDAEVQLYAATQFDGPVNHTEWKGKTDGTGYFKIWGIEVGERVQLYASAAKDGYTKARSDMIELSPKMMNQAIQITLPRGGEITGIVTDQNKMPIPGAEIEFNSSAFPGDPSPSKIVVHTQPNGTYRVENCPAGGSSVKVSMAGFVGESRGVTIRNDQVSDNINFELENGQVIAGVVEDLEGYPIAGAKVTANGIKGAAGSETDTTDKNGKFQLNNLGEGEFKLTATFQMDTPEGKQSYHFTNPSVHSGNVSTSIDCDLGNTTSGKVKGEKARGVPNFTVKLNSINDTKPSQEFVFNLSRGLKDAAGYFRMSKLPRGLYKLTVTADGYEPYVEDDVAIGPHRRTVLPDIRLNPAGGVVGRVFSSTSDRPVNNAKVRLESVDNLPTESSTVVSGSTNMRGEFRVATVPEGLYKVSVDHPSYIGMKMEMIHVTEKRERDLGKLYLEPGGAVRGTIVNNLGDPMPNMRVTVKGVTPSKQTTTDAAGNYLIQGVQFGRWPVVVQGKMSGKPMYVFQTSDIERDATERLDFMLEQTANLDGRLLASGETTVKSASVQIHPFDENNVVLQNIHYDSRVRSNKFDIDKVPPGQYFLWATGRTASDSIDAWKSIFLERGHNSTNVRISSSKVSGKVTSENGEPASNVAVQLLPIFNSPQLTRNLYDNLIKPTVTNKDGSFSFENVQPGTYQVLNQNAAGTGWYAQPLFRIGDGEQLKALNVLLND